MANDNHELGSAVEVFDDTADKKEKKLKNVDEFGNPLPKKKRGLLKVLFIVVPILLCAGFVFGLIHFNWFGARDILIDSVNRLDPAHEYNRRDYYTRRAELDAMRAMWEEEYFEDNYRLFAWEQALLIRESDLDFREQGLAEEELRLMDWEARRTPIYRRDQNSLEFEEMRLLGAMYAAMSPEAAAARLSVLETTHAAAILMFMSQRNAGAILAAIEPPVAADITRILLTN